VSGSADFVYCTRGGRDLHVDVYRPAGPENHATAILVAHGGGWRAGDRTMVRSRCEALAARGYTAVAVEYRLLDAAPWPAQAQDVTAAARWTREHTAELGIDPARIVLQGHSAGAHLALMTAAAAGGGTLDADFASKGPLGPVAAVIAYYPPSHLVVREMPAMDPGAPPGPELLAALRGEDGTGPVAMLLGPDATDEQAATVSPVNHVERMPPVILFHGTGDLLVAPVASVNLHRRLEEAGVPAELHLLAGVHHEFDITPSLTELCVATVDSFLRRHVLDPAGFAEEERTTNPMAAMTAMMRAQAPTA
jgi:acetyl esterase/lipase